MKHVKSKDAKRAAKKLGLNLKVYPLKLWMKSMDIELEHGKVNKLTNVTNDDTLLTAKITLAHILEIPDYYPRLFKLEKKGDKYWKNKEWPELLVNTSKQKGGQKSTQEGDFRCWKKHNGYCGGDIVNEYNRQELLKDMETAYRGGEFGVKGTLYEHWNPDKRKKKKSKY